METARARVADQEIQTRKKQECSTIIFRLPRGEGQGLWASPSPVLRRGTCGWGTPVVLKVILLISLGHFFQVVPVSRQPLFEDRILFLASHVKPQQQRVTPSPVINNPQARAKRHKNC